MGGGRLPSGIQGRGGAGWARAWLDTDFTDFCGFALISDHPPDQRHPCTDDKLNAPLHSELISFSVLLRVLSA